jgi:hypothetical protein
MIRFLQKTPIFFRRKYFKNHNIGLWPEQRALELSLLTKLPSAASRGSSSVELFQLLYLSNQSTNKGNYVCT